MSKGIPNYHENFKQHPSRYIEVWNENPWTASWDGYKDTTSTLQAQIQQSLEANEEIRALGNQWSFSPVAATTGTLIETRSLNYRFSLEERKVRTEYRKRRQNLYFVQAGNSIKELNTYLSSRERSLPTSGASNGQTIAGAISTGTHGAAIDFGGMPEFVKAIHTVVGPNRHVWLEPASDPVMQDDDLPEELGAEVVRDDDLFYSALVSFGSFGIIHGILIEVDERYYLHKIRRKCERERVAQLMQDLEFGDSNVPWLRRRPYHFSAIINPFDANHVYVTAMYREASMPEGVESPSLESPHGDDALDVIGGATDFIPIASKFIANRITACKLGRPENVAGTPGQIFGDTRTYGRTASSAIAVSLNDVNAVIDLLLGARGHAPVLIAVRYVTPTRATLGFTRYAPHTAVVEIDGPFSRRVKKMYRRAWKRLRNSNIPHTFHWGKLHGLSEGDVRSAYGTQVDTWITSRKKLLASRKLRDAFANEIVRNLGLNPYS